VHCRVLQCVAVRCNVCAAAVSNNLVARSIEQRDTHFVFGIRRLIEERRKDMQTHTHTHWWPTCSKTAAAAHHYILQHTATMYCSTLQHPATSCNKYPLASTLLNTTTAAAHTLQHTATHCNTLQHPTTHCSILQRTSTHTYTYPFGSNLLNASHSSAPNTATHCSTLQHIATHGNNLNNLQRTRTPCKTHQRTHTHTHWHPLCSKPATVAPHPTHCSILQHIAMRCDTLHHATKR